MGEYDEYNEYGISWVTASEARVDVAALTSSFRDVAAGYLLSPGEASAYSGIREDTLKHMARRGSLWAVKKGKVWMYWRDDLKKAPGQPVPGSESL